MVYSHVDKDATTASETGEATEGDQEPWAETHPTPSAGRKLLLSAAALGVLGVAAAVALIWRGIGSSGTTASAAASKQATGYSHVHRAGCSNWAAASQQLGNFMATSSHACAEVCSEHVSCVAYNFQTRECNQSAGLAPGACYLYSMPCHAEFNDCWDLEVKSQRTSAPTLTTTALSEAPTEAPTAAPSKVLTLAPTTLPPTAAPAVAPTSAPSAVRTPVPTEAPRVKVEKGTRGYFCPTKDDFLADTSAGGSVTTVDGGYTIIGKARVSTKYGWDLHQGGMSFDIDLSGMPTGRVADGTYLKSLTYLHMPQAEGQRGPFTESEVACTGTGSTSTSYCPEAEIMEAYGQAAWSLGWYLEKMGDVGTTAGGQLCKANAHAQNRPKCRAERFFDHAALSCFAAESDFVVKERMLDPSKPIHVKLTFEDIVGLNATYSQSDRQPVTIRMQDLTDGTGGVPTAASVGALAYGIREYGAALSSGVKAGEWAPGMHKAVGDPADWQKQWCDSSDTVRESDAALQVSNLKIYGKLIRGDEAPGCVQEAIDQDADKLNEVPSGPGP